jgi:hypothetical protein
MTAILETATQDRILIENDASLLILVLTLALKM